MRRFEMIEIRVQSPGGSQPFHLFRRREPEFIGRTESRKIERLSPIAGLRQDQEARDLTDQPAQLRINASCSDHVADDFLGQILVDRGIRRSEAWDLPSSYHISRCVWLEPRPAEHRNVSAALATPFLVLRSIKVPGSRRRSPKAERNAFMSIIPGARGKADASRVEHAVTKAERSFLEKRRFSFGL